MNLSPQTEALLVEQAQKNAIPVDDFVLFLIARYGRSQAGLDEAVGRDYSHEEINQFIEDDRLPPGFAEELKRLRPA